MIAGGKSVALYPSQTPGAPLVIVNGEEGEDKAFAAALQDTADCSLAVITGLDWDVELSPWPAPAIFPGQAAFAGGADEYLRLLTEEIVPAVEAELPMAPVYRALAGYSLAGLLASYAPYRTDAFARIACVSGSLWYPDFLSFMQAHAPLRLPEKAYFSLGDREKKSRNPLLREVENRCREAAALMQSLGARTVFELNPGNHFQDPTGRLARGVRWLLED